MVNSEKCVCCGAVIPEGRQVCPNCEAKRVVLKPCPFCGGSGLQLKWDYWCETYCIECDNCGCAVYQRWDIRDEAIEAWNRRADDAES